MGKTTKLRLTPRGRWALIFGLVGGLLSGAVFQADAWQMECASPGQIQFEAVTVLDLSTGDGDPTVVKFYSSDDSNVGTPQQQAIILNTLAIVQRDLRPLFDALPNGQLQVTFAPTVGFAFATAVVLNQHEHNGFGLAALFLHELGHVWDQQLATQEERTAFMEALPWKAIVTSWRSPNLPHSLRPMEAYANQFASDIAPCHLDL